jgi:hypothetical protein
MTPVSRGGAKKQPAQGEDQSRALSCPGPDLEAWKAALLREEAAFEGRKPALLRTHLGQFVAIRGGQVVDADPNRIELARRIRRKHPGVPVLITEVVERPRVVRLRSPRVVR